MTAQPTCRHKFSLYWEKSSDNGGEPKIHAKTKPQRATSMVDLQNSSSILYFQSSSSEYLGSNRESTSNGTSAFFQKFFFIHQPQSIRSIISNWNAYHHIPRLLYRPRYFLRRSGARSNSRHILPRWYRRKVLSQWTSRWALSRDWTYLASYESRDAWPSGIHQSSWRRQWR